MDEKRKEQLEYLLELRKTSALGGGQDQIEKLHKKGKLSARERIQKLLDPGSFHEIFGLRETQEYEFGMQKKAIPGDGCITGYGTIEGRIVYVFFHDATVFGGSLGKAFGDKICAIMDLAAETGAPVIGINDSGGARIQEGVSSLNAYSEVFYRNVKYSGIVPQISLILGSCAGGAVYSPALTDFIFMVEETSHMMITGPAVIKAVTGEEITMEDLGGAKIHGEKTGIAQFICSSEDEAFSRTRKLITFLPSNNSESIPIGPQNDPADRHDGILNEIIPTDPNKSYDMYEILKRTFDKDSLFPVSKNYAQNIITAFGRLHGVTVGVVANNPAFLAGVIDVDASLKASRFIRFCSAYSIPIVTFVDVPGFMPGVHQEHTGIIKHGAKILYAYYEAEGVPQMTVITRKAYGGAYVAMSSMPCADIVYAWPTAEIAVMGPQGAANIIHKREIQSAEDPKKKRAEKIAEYDKKFANPYYAAKRGLVSEVILPSETRERLISSLAVLRGKKKPHLPRKHGNIPL